MDNIIEIKNLKFEFNDSENGAEKVIDDLNLSIERGSFTVILGHNGSGKSTLAKLLNGLLKPTEGTVLVNGIATDNPDKEIEIKRTVGLVFQNPDNQLIASVVEEDVAFGPENLGLEPTEIRRRVDEALKSVDMYEFRDFAPNKLSGGQKQRVAIAGIIAMQPECIVLDEPTAMLDPSGRREVINTILRLNKEMGITVILITHYMDEAEFADRVIIMDDGQIVKDGTAADIFSNIGVLEKSRLSVPQTTELLNKLEISAGVVSVEDTVAAIVDSLKTEE
ncbi:MAG: energy-coupling factor transporter ATPase [Ruminococcaceae bacterium]|nr:energy-coupling factor transporter ATPase [Oscillospiraceae bacterium]